jgi:hypothetical protein
LSIAHSRQVFAREDPTTRSGRWCGDSRLLLGLFKGGTPWQVLHIQCVECNKSQSAQNDVVLEEVGVMFWSFYFQGNSQKQLCSHLQIEEFWKQAPSLINNFVKNLPPEFVDSLVDLVLV